MDNTDTILFIIFNFFNAVYCNILHLLKKLIRFSEIGERTNEYVDHAGPINFKAVKYNGSLPNLVLNPYSWTKVNIYF